MPNALQQAVLDALNYSMNLQRDGVEPSAARKRLQSLRARHPELEIDLLAEQQVFDGSFHYDALLRQPGEGTISLSYCVERAVPWPLRGVHRWSETDLVRVNANVLQVDAAIACLDFIWDEGPIIERLVNRCLIQEELDREPIELTDSELQEAMDRFRAAKQLFKAADTLDWLNQHGMTHEALQTYVSETAIVPKLRDRIAEGRVEDYLYEHVCDFDRARVAQIKMPDKHQAQVLAEKIRSGVLEFYAAAEHLFLESKEREASLFATIERRDVASVFRDTLFASKPDQLVGPVLIKDGYVLMRVLAVTPAKSSEQIRGMIKERIFREWLAERRKTARIEWCWGNVNKTSNPS